MSTEIRYEKLNTKDIVVNPLAQREVESRKAQFNRIMNNFRPELVNPIKIARINGKNYCFDGQMTMKVLRERAKKNTGKDSALVDCLVFYGLTELDMATLFADQDKNHSKVMFADKVRVMKNFGDPEMTDFVKKTEAGGLYIAWKTSNGMNAVNAVSSLFKCYKELSASQDKLVDQYQEFVEVIKNAWDGEQNSLRAQILRGVSLFMKTYVGKYDTERLVRKLKEVHPDRILRDASVDRSRGDRKYAVIVLNIYNGSLRNPLPNLL